jgi:hypothetical protein
MTLTKSGEREKSEVRTAEEKALITFLKRSKEGE